MGLLHQWCAVMILLLLQMRCYSSNSQHLTCHPRDQEALREFNAEFDPYPPYVWRFNSSSDCCEWSGVTCKSSSLLGLNNTNNTARVTKLELVNMGSYGGKLSESLGRLDQIRVLNLSGNFISGSIPSSIFNLVNLETLDLSSNELIGGIPKSLANSRNLILLNLGYNLLSGPLHLHCDAMTSLTSLDLRYNNFNGSLPKSLPSCKNLRSINLMGNSFQGKVPESFKDFHSLIDLSLSNCRLVNISSTLHILQQCKNLTTLDLSYNFQEEMLPDHPSLHFENLKVLIVGKCRLTGQIPSWLRKSTNLQVLDLSSNGLTGPISNWIDGFTNLFYLDLSLNLLTGEIPKSLTRLQSLSRNGNLSDIRKELQIDISKFLPTIELSQNKLSGPIWEEFGNLSKLRVFDLSDNRLSGSIPESLNYLSRLSMFSVANNNLSGRIPRGRLSETFSSWSFEGNHFSGDEAKAQATVSSDSITVSEKKELRGSPQREVDTQESDIKPRSRTNEEDYVLDFSYGVAFGYGLALVIVSLITCSAFELHGK